MKILLVLVLAQVSDEEMTKRRVESAINRGAKYLLRQIRNSLPRCESEATRYDELVLYTLVHAGVDRSDPDFKTVLKSVVEGPYDRTYSVALRAMALEAIDASKYKPEILMCAQYLVDQQCEDGRWGYGTEMKLKRMEPDPKEKPGTKVKEVVKPTPKTERGKAGDNSNSQYALLGLRACMKTGIEIDPTILERTVSMWERAQRGDGGWGYDKESSNGDEPYGSMTAGAIASLIIAKTALKKPWKDDVHIKKGLEWLNKNWSTTEHPKYPDPKRWFHYYVYAIERCGDLMGVEKLGDKEWYPEIRDFLIKSQKSDSSWAGSDELAIADTCFAILFLRRATKPGVITGTNK